MSNASTFRTYARIEDRMLRAVMPRTSAADPLPEFRPSAPRTWRAGRLTTLAPLTFTLAEVR